MKKGFTLAEVLITLAIIGVVAALTIPSLVQNYQTKTWNTSNDVFKKKFEVALRTMNLKGELTGFKTTEQFIEKLGENFKIIKSCSTPTDCFNDKITWGNNEINLSEITSVKQFATEDYETNLIGLQFANGVSAILSYNPKCNPDPYNNQSNVWDCIAMMYDVSGYANPNEQGKDVRITSNVKTDDFGVLANINGVKVKKVVTANDITPINCTSESAAGSDWQYCFGTTDYSTDYWSAEVKACGGRNNLPTPDELALIAQYLYNNESIGAKTDTDSAGISITMDPDKANELIGYGIPIYNANIWSSSTAGGTNYYGQRRLFGKTISVFRDGSGSARNQKNMTLCIAR